MADHDAHDHTGIPGVGTGGLTLLEQHTASASSSLDFTTFISSTYDDYLIRGVNLRPASNGENLLVQCGTGGGPTWDTGNNYSWGAAGQNGSSGATVLDNGVTGSARILILVANNAAYGLANFQLSFTNPQGTSQRRKFYGNAQYASTTTPAEIYQQMGFTWTNSTTAMTGLRFIMTAGNITSGTIRIYGLAK